MSQIDAEIVRLGLITMVVSLAASTPAWSTAAALRSSKHVR